MKRKLTARETAAKLCTLGNQTKKTLYMKLYKNGFSDEDISSAVSAMDELGYIDEKAYIRAYIRDSYNIKRHGHMRIIRELVMRGISNETAEHEVYAYGADECEMIKSEYEKRFSEEDDIMKIMRYFIGRGFSADDIRGCIDD